jgi:undecaprenyl-diphosphatase
MPAATVGPQSVKPLALPWGVVNLELLRALNGFVAHRDAVEDPVTFYVTASEVLFASLVVAVFLAGGRRGARSAVAALAAAAIALGVGLVLAHVVNEQRPFVAHPHVVHALIGHKADASFPSDHATAAFAIATAIWLRMRVVGAIALVLAAVLAVARVAVGVHYPLDVAAGAALGTGAAVVLWWPPLRRVTDAVADRLSTIAPWHARPERS